MTVLDVVAFAGVPQVGGARRGTPRLARFITAVRARRLAAAPGNVGPSPERGTGLVPTAGLSTLCW